MNILTLKDKSLLEILDIYNVKLFPKGQHLNAFCPLHPDNNTPNFFYFKETDSFYCFSCHKGGNAIDFIHYIENIEKNEIYKTFYGSKSKMSLHLRTKQITYEDVYIMLAFLWRKMLEAGCNLKLLFQAESILLSKSPMESYNILSYIFEDPKEFNNRFYSMLK